MLWRKPDDEDNSENVFLSEYNFVFVLNTCNHEGIFKKGLNESYC